VCVCACVCARAHMCVCVCARVIVLIHPRLAFNHHSNCEYTIIHRQIMLPTWLHILRHKVN